ncbi:MAG: translocation/assembly module TamB domain-containing protein, partial [Caldimonas sp.]
LPVEIEIASATVDELRFGADASAAAVSQLHARVHLGADGGGLHRFDDLSARYDGARATGSATIGADAPFAVDAKLAAASVDATPAWQASATASGPLEAIDVAASARVTPTATRPAQSFDGRAVVRPFAPWPLGDVHVATQDLDLSAFAGAAPQTSLSGEATATSSGPDRPAVVSIALANGAAGRWNEGRLPVLRVTGELRARPDDPRVLDVQSLVAELGTDRLAGGRITAAGRWAPDGWNVAAELRGVRPSALDARAPETSLDGKVDLVGTGFATTTPPSEPVVEVRAALAGPLVDKRLPKSAPGLAHLKLDARVAAREIELRSAEARAGKARATLSGRLVRSDANAPWHATGKAALADFDPAPWWPGATDSLWSRGVNRLDAKGDFDLVLQASNGDLYAQLAALRGRAHVAVADSLIAGVAITGSAALVNPDGAARPTLDLVAGGNTVHAQGRLGASGGRDEWQLAVDAPQLATLARWLGAPAAAKTGPRKAPIAGALKASGRIDGRWPDVRSEGELHGTGLRYDTIAVRRAEGRWKVGSAADAALDATLDVDGLAVDGRAVDSAEARLAGTARAHRIDLRIDSQALPPEWVDTLAARAGPVTVVAAPSAPSASSAPALPAASAAAPATARPSSGRSELVLHAEGGLVDIAGARSAGWKGTIREISARSVASPSRTWVSAKDIRGSIAWAGGPMHAELDPGSADALGATLRWSRVAWRAGEGGAAATLDAHAVVDALAVAPLLRALQPDFGWGGDLAVGAHLDVSSAPTVTVDVVVERARGDLTVTDEFGTQALGLTDLRLGVAARDGQWSFTAGLAGSTLGVASGAVTANTDPHATWPGPQTPIQGVFELRVANLGTWGTWVPAGWRLAGELHASASIGGRFGAPSYTGHVEGTKLGVRNFLQGVNVTDGDLALALEGNTARIEHFTAQGGNGTVSLQGKASFDDAPVAQLKLSARKFELLGRVDRRIVASGDASLRLDAKTLALDGGFTVDEGLIDFTRSDAPTLGDDVEVIRRPAAAPLSPAAAASAAMSPTPTPAPVVAPATRQVALDLRVGMGENLRIKGRGLDAGLRGDLRLTSPAGRLTVDGTLRVVDGTYQAYGQKLTIDRGVLTFVGPIENPRLDIQATRPNLDVRVGVVVAGSALNPRVRLFSEPAMSDIDTLSWLVLGRASEGAGRDDIALLQSAALALLSGEGPGATDRLTRALGLDAISVRQQDTGAVKETIVSVGKQISKRWYVGYERGTTAASGSWQLIYRIARRLTLRAQAGGDNSIDLIWTLRWK